jgi:putative peptide zinc metalloprotease protein
MTQLPAGRNPRLRADLQITRRADAQHAGVTYWIHHPITGQTVRLQEGDYRRLTREPPRDVPRSIDLNTVSKDVDLDPLWREAAVHQMVAGTGTAVAGTSTVASPVPWWTNPLYIRIPGYPADRLARWLAATTGWLFAMPAIALWVVLFCGTVIVLTANWNSLWTSLTGLADFQARNWAFAIGILGITKVIHECGHAAVCRRMGARCRQMGVLILCGTPCLYCDVTDSWRVVNPYRRAAVMMAGVYVEWVIATIAAWVWFVSDAATVRMGALHVMVVCGVSTLLFNLNPLMRYDGYFVLSDLANVPNLRRRAVEAWNRIVMRPITGVTWPEGTPFRSSFTRCCFAAYHGMSVVYRYVITFAIASWIALVLSRCGLEPVGRCVVIVAVAVVVFSICRRGVAMLRGVGHWHHVPWLRRATLVIAVTTGVIFILTVPIQHRITATGYVDYAAAESIYVTDDGTVTQMAVEFGDHVDAGQSIARLSNTESEAAQAVAQTRVDVLDVRLALYRERSAARPEYLEHVTAAEARLQAAETHLAGHQQQLDRLHLRATRSGEILRPLPSPDSQPIQMDALKDRGGARIRAGEIWCRIGNRAEKQILLTIDASERGWVQEGTELNVSIPALATRRSGGVVHLTVEKISPVRHDAEAIGGSPESFEVVCRLPRDLAPLVSIGSSATAVIHGSRFRLCGFLWDKFLGSDR